MPASRSRKREPEPAPSRGAPTRSAPLRGAPLRLFWPIAWVSVAVIGAVLLIALPASLIARFLPPPIHAEDFSGSVWHGSAARITVDSRAVGALEWRLHPLSLLLMSVVADLHWVKGSTVIDGNVALDAHGFVAHGVRGGGPLEDLRDLGVAPGWHGNTTLDLREIKGSFDAIASATGTIDVSALSSSSVAAGADLGSYQVTLAPEAVNAGTVSAMIKDTGGPLEVEAEVHYTPASHLGLLSGTIRERPGASPALRNELTNLSQLKARDSAGRIPIDLEFSL
jgi:general secretion pathway protein N